MSATLWYSEDVAAVYLDAREARWGGEGFVGLQDARAKFLPYAALSCFFLDSC